MMLQSSKTNSKKENCLAAVFRSRSIPMIFFKKPEQAPLQGACLGADNGNRPALRGRPGRGSGAPSALHSLPLPFDSHDIFQKPEQAPCWALVPGADNGNRTHLYGLGSRRSTDELYPRLGRTLTKKGAKVNPSPGKSRRVSSRRLLSPESCCQNVSSVSVSRVSAESTMISFPSAIYSSSPTRSPFAFQAQSLRKTSERRTIPFSASYP